MCYFNRLSRVARWLADYSEWLQFCWDFVKPPRNDEIALQKFFLACSGARIFFLFYLCCMQFFSSNKRLQDFFFKITTPPPTLSRVKWSAPKGCCSDSIHKNKRAKGLSDEYMYQCKFQFVF